MDFNIKNVILISLKSHNEDQLKAISIFYQLSFYFLLELKESTDKIWIEKGGNQLIAFINKGFSDFVIGEHYSGLTKKERDALWRIQKINTPKVAKNELHSVEPSFNVSNVICIDMNSFKEVHLRSVSKIYEISEEWLLKLKQSYKKVWTETGNNNENGLIRLIAFMINDKAEFVYNFRYLPDEVKINILSIKPIGVPNSVKNAKKNRVKKVAQSIEELAELDIDSILDKILKYGINSLTKREVDFLKSQ